MTEERQRYFTRRYEQYLASTVDDHMSPTETMANKRYMSIGASAAAAVYAACLSSWLHRVDAVLDLPCGHGRVLRHLVKLFPEARFDACDLDRDGVDFCARRFGATPLYSREDLTMFDPGRRYDLIWVGSLFTHVSRARTRAWLAHLARFLSDTGIMVATFHGRYSAGKGLEYGYTEEARWREIVREYEATGYGYRDYPPSIGHDFIEGAYGVSLSSPTTVIADAMAIPGIRVLSYTERGWAEHQDVLTVGKPDVMT